MKSLLYTLLLLMGLTSAAMSPEARRSFLAFEQRAENGDPEAQYRLSAILEKGFDTIPADTLRSLSLLRRAANAGYAPAMNYLGYLYQTGFPLPEQPCEGGSPLPSGQSPSVVAPCEGGSPLTPGQSPSVVALCEGGSPKSLLIPQNPDSAQYWLHRAATAGDPKAAHNLAYLLLNPPALSTPSTSPSVAPSTSSPSAGTPAFSSGERAKPDSLAIIYLTQAAEAGLPQSQTLLADLCVQGRGLAPDTLRAIALYERAIAAGFPDAELRLLNTIGPRITNLPPEEALSEALRYWNMGAPAIATTILLPLTETTTTVTNIESSAESPTLARIYALLGHAYSRGRGVPYDHHTANEYFARAALLGNPSARFILAETLEIFPDALTTLLPDLTPQQTETLTPDHLRAQSALAGRTTAEPATAALTAPALTPAPKAATTPGAPPLGAV